MKFISLILLAAALSVCAAEPTVRTASWYGDELRGRSMANGKPFNPDNLTVASWHYPLGTVLRVTSEGGKTVDVTVTDRGPAKRLVAAGRVLDLSKAAFTKLADPKAGLVRLSNIEVLP